MSRDDDSTSMSLLQRVKHRNQDAWQRLYELYAPLVTYWCHDWGVRGADADDLRQDVFLSVSKSLDTFRRDRPGDSFRAWLRTITRRKVLDRLRQSGARVDAQGGSEAQRRLLSVPEADDDSTVGDPPAELRKLHQRALNLIRSHFEEQTWLAFYRCVVESQSPIDVAKALKTTPAAVRKAKSRVLRRLKEELGDLLEES